MTKIADPLLAALFATLPAPGSVFVKRERDCWLEMLNLRFNSLYPDQVAGKATASAPQAPATKPTTTKPATTKPTAAKPGPKPSANNKTPVYFSIDPDGFAMRNGKPVAPEEIPEGAAINDEREGSEAGDLASILWKDVGAISPESLPALNIKIVNKQAA